MPLKSNPKSISVSPNLHRYIMNHKDADNIQTVFNWLEKINISINNNSLSNITLDQFCQQQSMNFKERYENKVICYRSFDISKEYAPQEIARWYIANPDV